MEAIATSHRIWSWPSLLQRAYAPSIRTSLAVLVVGCVVPIALVAAFLIVRFYEGEQAQLTMSAIGRARAMVTSLDRDFTGTESALQALGTSRRLTTGDLAGFRERAVEALQNIRADSIVVVDMSGQLLLSTRRPFGEPLPKLSSTPLLNRVLASGKPAVSDLYIGPVVGRLIFTIAVPVTRNGSTVLLLNATAAPAQIAGVLTDQALPSSWIATITDSTGHVVARTRAIDKFLGETVNPDLRERMNVSNEGSFRSRTLEDIPVVTVFSRSPTTKWAAVIGIPLNELTAGLRHTLNWLIAGTVTALGLGFALAWFIGGRVARSISALTKPALALASGETLTIPRLHFKEANEMGKAMLDAATTLRQSNYDAHHDSLTGLPNRALFQIAVSQQLALCDRNKIGLAVLYIDLDGFKAVNDTNGHAVGDQLLREVSARIDSSIRASDIAARLGGDEFAIALIHADLDHAASFAAGLIEGISKPYQLGQIEAKVSASIGVAGYPVTATDIDMLLKKADQAMYAAKASGKKCCCVANP